jgi:hypothetical protein
MKTVKADIIEVRRCLDVWIFLDEEGNIMFERNPEVGDPREICSSDKYWYLPGFERTAQKTEALAALHALWKEQGERFYAHDCTTFLETLVVKSDSFKNRETFLAPFRLWLRAYYVDHHDDVPLALTPGTERKFLSLEDAMVHYAVGPQDRAALAIFMDHMSW